MKIRIILPALIFSQVFFLATKCEAYNPLIDHVQSSPSTQTMMLDYIPGSWNSILVSDPSIKEFMNANYDAIIGGHDMSPYTSNKPPEFMYTNYYCVYVDSVEFQDARDWAASNNVDFESFFIHSYL